MTIPIETTSMSLGSCHMGFPRSEKMEHMTNFKNSEPSQSLVRVAHRSPYQPVVNPKVEIGGPHEQEKAEG